MTMDDSRRSQSPLPAGYRQGVISAITVVIGFSLLFLRYWGFEARGLVTGTSIAAGLLLVVAILLSFTRCGARSSPRTSRSPNTDGRCAGSWLRSPSCWRASSRASLASTGISP